MSAKINWNEFVIKDKKSTTLGKTGERVHMWTVTYPRILTDSLYVVGIDPGRNYGFTILGPYGTGWVYYGKLIKHEPDEAYTRYITDEFVPEMVGMYPIHSAVVEGAAYDKTFGQVGLEAIRCGFYAGMERICPTRIAPPSTVRKAVFGNGKTQAMDMWTTINHNAADSLAIAIYALVT